MKNRRLGVRVVFFVCALALCFSSGSTVLTLLARKELVIQRKKELDRVSRENEKLSALHRVMQGNAYIERIARDKLGLVKDGETIVLIGQQEADVTQKSTDTDTPNWRQWWEVFN